MADEQTLPLDDVVLAPSTIPTAIEAALPIDSIDLAYRETLLAVLVDGQDVPAVSGKSIGSNAPTRERRNHSLEFPDARDRIVAVQNNAIRSTLAVGRFLWMMAGSDRLDDIRFYESSWLTGDRTRGVSQFSDDGLAISGSNYGQRLFRPSPGVDQVQACINLIKADPVTRRAALAIYRPEDAGRDSTDIPCTFGMVLSPRSGALNITTIMRSNNAWILLPYNVFEFSLLGELVATETDLHLGSYYHFAASMHIYAAHVDAAREAIGGPGFRLESFGPMPEGSLSTVRELCKWESSIRYRHRGLTKKDVTAEIKRTGALFGEFWSPFARVALTKALLNAKKTTFAHDVARVTRGPLGQLLRHELELEELPTARDPDALVLTREELERVHEDRGRVTADERVDATFHIMVAREKLREASERAARS
jgi:thymidylate synthase